MDHHRIGGPWEQWTFQFFQVCGSGPHLILAWKTWATSLPVKWGEELALRLLFVLFGYTCKYSCRVMVISMFVMLSP